MSKVLGRRPSLILATWNINGVVRRLDNLLRWLGETKPDVVCLQELKCSPARFPVRALEDAGYGSIWRAEGRWNGVAILAKNKVPIPTCLDLPGDAKDDQARYIEAAIDGTIIASVYAPNGNPQPGPKFDYKLAWMSRLKNHAADRLSNKVPAIFSGDFNVVQSGRDIYETTSYNDNAMTQPEAQAALQQLLELGLVDTYAKYSTDDRRFTFWDYRRNRWRRNAGLRLDLILANEPIEANVKSIHVQRNARGWPGASDHAPLVVHI